MTDAPGPPQWASPGPPSPVPPPAESQPVAPIVFGPPSSYVGYIGPAKPGIVALRPLGLSDILDGAIGYIRRDLRAVMTISALLALALALLTALTNYASIRTLGQFNQLLLRPADTVATDQLPNFAPGWESAVGFALTNFVGVVATGVLTAVVGEAVLGRRVAVGEAWARARPRLIPLFGLSLLTGLIVFGGLAIVGAVALGMGALLEQVVNGLGIVVGLLIAVGGVCAAIWVNFLLLLAAPALVLERVGVRTALRRSVRLVRGAWWRIFAISILAGIIAGLISQVLAIPFAVGGLAAAVVANGSLWWLALLLTSLGSFFAALITIPFTAGVTALQYIDQRIRREALDLELARAAGR